MCETAVFRFNEPGLTLAILLVLPLALLYPAWVLSKVSGRWSRRLAFLARPPGLPVLLVVLTFLAAQGSLLFRAYGGFWAVQLDQSGRVELTYWWPKRAARLDPGDVRQILVTTERFAMRGGNAERDSLALETGDGRRLRSQHLLGPGQVGSIAQALATCTAAPVLRATQTGPFGQPAVIGD